MSKKKHRKHNNHNNHINYDNIRSNVADVSGKSENIVLDNRRTIILTVISIIILMAVVVVSTYAVIMSNSSSNTKDLYQTGNINVTFDEDTSSSINLTGELPISDNAGKSKDPYTFTITGNDDNDYKSKYTIRLIPQADSVIPTSKIKIQVNDNEPVLLSTFTDNIIDSGILNKNESADFEIRLWIDYNADASIEGQKFSAKVSVTGQAVRDDYTE